MKKQSIVIAIILCLAAIALSYLITPQALCEQVSFYPAQVADISDRAYEQAVIDLLDKAQDSITISMFILKPGDYDKHPINRLMRDLEEALERGVSVTLYLNTKTGESDPSLSEVGQGQAFDALRQKGAQILPVTSRYMLHDKMLIVDGRFVVIGSTNWSLTALTGNLESTVLIDSPALAKERLQRMKTIHLQGEDLRGPPQDSLKERYPLPEAIQLPKALMENSRYFSRMLNKSDHRAMDLYLLLIAESHRRNSTQFYVSLEKIAGQLNLPRDWDATALRRQVIKSLRKLKNRYGLIEVRFKHARAAEIEMIDIAGETFLFKSDFFEASFLAGQRQNQKFILLIKAYLQAQGKDIADFNNSELGRMFYVHRTTLGKGLR